MPQTGTTMGPVTTPRGLAKAEAQAADAVKLGAKMVLGTGKSYTRMRPKMRAVERVKVSEGYFMDPTIMTNMNERYADEQGRDVRSRCWSV